LLIPSDKYEDYKNGKVTAVFLKFKPKKDRFYLYDCFNEKVEANPDITKDWILE